MKSKLLTISLCCVLFLSFGQVAFSQQKMTMTFEEGEITIVQGIGAIIKGGDKGLAVEFVPPKDSRQKEYKEVDLLAKDKIIMCNGKKVKTIEDLDAIIEKIEIGGEISFGIKRKKEMLIISFPKADPKASGNMAMTMTVDEDGGGSETTIMKDGVELKDVTMLEAGMILKDIDGQINIMAVFPELKSICEGDKPQDDDVFISLNGTKMSTANELNKAYNKIKYGDLVSCKVLRDDKELSFSFNKPEVDSGDEVIMHR